MKRMRGMTAEERSIFWCVMHNLAQDLSYRVRQYNDADGMKKSIEKRREREMFQAIERLAEAYNAGISDAALGYFGGPKAVKERDNRKAPAANVVPLKRAGFVINPLSRERE